MKILLLILAPLNISPAQRFRFEQYLPFKGTRDIDFQIEPFLDKKGWSVIHLPNHFFQKIFAIASGFARRVALLPFIFRFDYVYILREASSIGPPIFEWLIAKVFRKKIIYDFDDAIWVRVASESNRWAADVKCTWKVANICRMSYTVTVGNDFLGDYARKYCKDVRLIPTVVNTDDSHNRLKNHGDLPLCVGWTGTFTNFYNLKKVTAVITRLKQKYDFEFLIIADKDPKIENLSYVYKKWNVHTEIDDLLKIHIGIMPLEDSEVEWGKCAFKAIQYMSLGIPPVVSPVGANCTVVQNNINGFWADGDGEWYNRIEELLINRDLREQIGIQARKRIEDHYSVNSTVHLFYDLFPQKMLNDFSLNKDKC